MPRTSHSLSGKSLLGPTHGLKRKWDQLARVSDIPKFYSVVKMSAALCIRLIKYATVVVHPSFKHATDCCASVYKYATAVGHQYKHGTPMISVQLVHCMVIGDLRTSRNPRRVGALRTGASITEEGDTTRPI